MSKKILLLFILLIASAPLQAQDEQSELVKNSNRQTAETRLVNMDSSRFESRLDELERRISQLERENKDQDNRIRSLDRALDTLERRV